MKKGYKRLLFFEIILLFIFFLNSFVWNILNEYNMLIFLIISIIIFKMFIGVEKDRHRYTKDIIFNILIFLLASLLIYYLFGILIGFYKIDNYFNLYGLKTFIIPMLATIILKEYLRYQVLTKSEESKLFIIIAVIIFILIDISNAIYYRTFDTLYSIFMFVALTLLPSISSNIAASYISIKVGYKPNIIWILITKMYIYFTPIVPNPNEYILSVIRFVFPLLIAYRVYMLFTKVKDEEISRNYNKCKKGISLIIPTILVVIMVYLTSGYFHYYAIAIASGSMHPQIKKGDVVIIEKVSDNYDTLKVGEVLAFKYNDVIVVHRIINIVNENNKYYFYSKGDANNNADNFVISEDMVIGVVNYKVPYIGLPTVWLNEL